jgi:hypothetical protein
MRIRSIWASLFERWPMTHDVKFKAASEALHMAAPMTKKKVRA